MIRVACVGHASLDQVWRVAALPGPGKTLAHGYHARPGGMSLHAAVAAARLGASVRLLGRVGDDAAAATLRARLVAEGIEPRGLESVRGARTSIASVIVDAEGERQIVVARGDAIARAHALDKRQLEGADVVLADPRWPDGAAVALAWARRHGVLSLLDAEVAPLDDLKRLVPLARWVAFSQPGLALWAPGRAREEALREVLRLGAEGAVVTLGPQGACWVERGAPSLRCCAAPAVNAIDTTAAGDVFHAALGLGLAQRCASADAMAWACAAAAFKCEQGFGSDAAPTRDSLEAWMRARA